LRSRRSGVRFPPGTLCCLCSNSSRDRSGGRSPGSYPGGRRFESDSRNFHALVVEPPVDTPASEAGARDEHASSTLARGTATSRWLERETRRAQTAVPSGVRVRLPPWTTLEEGEPAGRRRRLEPGGHRPRCGARDLRPPQQHHLEGDLAMEPDLIRNECASSPAWGSSPPPSAWRVNAGWSAARLESGAVPQGAGDRALRSPLSWNVIWLVGASPSATR
jgi:hypothetical protein